MPIVCNTLVISTGVLTVTWKNEITTTSVVITSTKNKVCTQANSYSTNNVHNQTTTIVFLCRKSLNLLPFKFPILHIMVRNLLTLRSIKQMQEQQQISNIKQQFGGEKSFDRWMGLCKRIKSLIANIYCVLVNINFFNFPFTLRKLKIIRWIGVF